MNINVATIYARQGYRIYRNPEWLDPDTKNVAISLGIISGINGQLFFVWEDGSGASLYPEDCLADDWEIIK